MPLVGGQVLCCVPDELDIKTLLLQVPDQRECSRQTERLGFAGHLIRRLQDCLVAVAFEVNRNALCFFFCGKDVILEC